MGMNEQNPHCNEKPKCPNCQMPSQIIWIHGHGQCSVCGVNVEPCCSGSDVDMTGDRDNQEIEITNGAMVPFLLGTRGLHETSYQGSMQPGGSAFVLKEFMGLKAILVCKYIPIWQEAWYSRRKIIGYKRVYYLKYVPCEYLKSIIYKDTIKGVEKYVKTIQHCDHALLSYWNFPLKR